MSAATEAALLEFQQATVSTGTALFGSIPIVGDVLKLAIDFIPSLLGTSTKDELTPVLAQASGVSEAVVQQLDGFSIAALLRGESPEVLIMEKEARIQFLEECIATRPFRNVFNIADFDPALASCPRAGTEGISILRLKGEITGLQIYIRARAGVVESFASRRPSLADTLAAVGLPRAAGPIALGVGGLGLLLFLFL